MALCTVVIIIYGFYIVYKWNRWRAYIKREAQCERDKIMESWIKEQRIKNEECWQKERQR